MPLYRCLVPAGSLDAGHRAEPAEAITSTHIPVARAPRGFANVMFTEYEPMTFPVTP